MPPTTMSRASVTLIKTSATHVTQYLPISRRFPVSTRLLQRQRSMAIHATGEEDGRSGIVKLKKEDTAHMLTETSSRGRELAVLQEMKSRLERDLRNILTNRGVDASNYAETMEFLDPVTNIRGRSEYLIAIQALRVALQPEFIVHSITIAEPDQIRVRWTTRMYLPVPVPFNLRDRPTAHLTGESIYTADTESRLFTRQVDTWDSVPPESQRFFSVDGLRDMVGMSLEAVMQSAPALETPDYEVLKRTSKYEIRQYAKFMVASKAMGSGSTASGGEGFNDLAGFIGGRNESGARMEMTTPVFTSGGEGDKSMRFVLEKRMGDDPATLPRGSSVECREEDLGIVAALRFGGLALDRDVRMAEEELREALDEDGYQSKGGFELARYNDPFTPPFLRRNEVLIRISNWDMESFGPKKPYAQ